MTEIKVKPPFIKLEQLLKLACVYETGGEAKLSIQEGRVKVNGSVCLMRGKKLYDGDKVEAEGESFVCKISE